MTTWTTETEKKLHALWEKGLSAAAIGREIGTTRSAICGKAFRMGLSLRGRKTVDIPGDRPITLVRSVKTQERFEWSLKRPAYFGSRADY